MTTLAIARHLTEYYMSKKIPVFLWGPPGVGKSDMVSQIAQSRSMGLVDFRAVLRDPVDLRGIPTVDLKARKSLWLPPDDLPQEKRDGKTGVLFLDELNAANQQVQAACFGLVLDKKVGEYHLPTGWEIIAAGNRQSDRSAAQRMPRALANRFAHVDVEADAKTWIEDYAYDNCHELVIGFIRFRPNLIHDMDTPDERAFPTPRAWAGVSEVAGAPDNLRYNLVKGLVGEGAAAEFEGFVQTYKNLPDLEDIIRKPKTTPVPGEPSALYAVATGLSRYATRDNFDSVMTYAERLGREYEIIIALDACRREAMLTKTKAYIEFIKRNKDIQIGQFRMAS